MKEAQQDPIYRPYTTVLKSRTVPRPIRINGEMVTEYQAPVVTEYLDTRTGEILPAAELRDSRDVWPTTYPGEAMQLAVFQAVSQAGSEVTDSGKHWTSLGGFHKLTPKALTPEQEKATLFWEVIPPPVYSRKHAANAASVEPKERKKTRPSKSAANPHNALFKDCWTVEEVTECVPPETATILDNILTGVALLDQGGNTRPVPRRLLLDLLRELGEISTETVQIFTGLSTSYSRKIAGLVRIAVSELNKIATEGLAAGRMAGVA